MTQKRIEAFLQIADEEMVAAERLHAPLPTQAEYFLQQTEEKLIRATLEAAEIPAGTAHSLSFLAGLLPPNHKLRLRYMEFEHLSSASTRYRYPSGTGPCIRSPPRKLRETWRAFKSCGLRFGISCRPRGSYDRTARRDSQPPNFPL